MSDAKKTGSRDISELKQRLGLKKGAAAQTGAAPVARSNGAPSGGVVPPPGLNLPPPPGVAQPQPQMPNAAEDPFAAMNAMAAVGTVQRAPEIVIVNDGKPVENVGAGSGSLLKLLIPSLVALLVGVAIGKIGTSASNYNDGIKGTKIILGDKASGTGVAGLKATLAHIDHLLEEAAKVNFRPDKDLDKALKADAAKLDVKPDQIALARYANPEVAQQTLAFYAGVTEIKSMLNTHVVAAGFDDQAFAKAKQKAADAELKPDENALLAGQYRYGIYLPQPSEGGGDYGAKLVELGPPYCGGGTAPAATGKCPEDQPFAGFSWRADPGAAWNKSDVAGGDDKIQTKKLVLLADGGVRDSLVKGAEGVASETFYVKRLRTIYELVHGVTKGQSTVGGLLDEGNKLEQKLSTEASKGTKFSFFM